MKDQSVPLAGCVPAFGQHRTYPPRRGWLLKVHTALQDDPHVFQRPDASVVLGVGSSMVTSMRFWAGAFGLVERDTAGSPGAVAATARGRWLLDEEDGADPYLDDRASLWLLHWWLLTGTPCSVPSWYYVFAVHGFSRFTRAELLSGIQRAIVRSGWRSPADDTVRRDIACLAAMYAPQVGSVDQPRAGLEDILANPFGDLGLLSTAAPRSHSRGDRSHEITVATGAGRTAPAAVLLYACLDYAARDAAAPGSIAVARLASGPGRIMLLDSGSLRRALERAASRHPAVSVGESGAGEILLAYDAPPAVLADQVLAGLFCRPSGPSGV
ncbi:DUF4007 family protein [Streptomyces clavuligerus]|uniref:DUF4007 family protein n=1 Tax=Streptomyces clavuligerus TaxID=1901 RepID=UPI000492B84C|nr:DUF4007 family protein [Streptomyces clavuligerus]WDN56184.1 DUF4007 family protein [Streptomyces clavuligerus]